MSGKSGCEVSFQVLKLIILSYKLVRLLTKVVRTMRKPISDETTRLEITNGAYKLAAERILDGSASNQLILFFLKQDADSKKSELEMQRLEAETELAKAKVKSIENAELNNQLITNAMEALYRYKPGGSSEDL